MAEGHLFVVLFGLGIWVIDEIVLLFQTKDSSSSRRTFFNTKYFFVIKNLLAHKEFILC